MSMNRAAGMALANVALALVFLLGAGTAQAFTINTSDNGTNATGIEDFLAFFNVTFERTTALDLYGDPESPDFDFDAPDDALVAVAALSAALNTDPTIMTVGPDGDGSIQFAIGFGTQDSIAQLVFI